MTKRLGIALSTGAVRGLLVRDNQIVWRAQQSLESPEQLTECLTALLADAPWSRLARPRALAAIGMGSSQLKRLRGLPAISDPHAISALLRPNVNRFFLKNGTALRLSEINRNDEAWWAAVAEEPIVAAVEDTCRRLGVRLEGCVPTAVALTKAYGDGVVEWRDGADVTYVALSGGAVTRLARSGRPMTGIAAALAAPLSSIGDDALQFADAYGAAKCTRRTSLLLRTKPSVEARRGRKAAFALVTVLLVLAGIFAALAPGLAAERAQHIAERRLASLQAAAAEVARQDAELRRVSKELDAIARFAAGRKSVVSLLGRVAQILPESTAMLAFHVDSASGSIVLLSTSGTELLPEIARLEGLESADLVGTVASQTFGTARLQRMMIRYRLASHRKAH